jgi:hypothetical protein
VVAIQTRCFTGRRFTRRLALPNSRKPAGECGSCEQRWRLLIGAMRQEISLAAGKPRVSPLMQIFQISQAVFGKLPWISLARGH